MNKNLLKSRFVMQGLTYAEVAQKMGISKNTLCNKMNSVVPFNTNEAIQLCNILQIEDDHEKAEIFLS